MVARDSIELDISSWLIPSRALEILRTVFKEKNLAEHELLQRLRGGMVRAVCRHATIDGQRLKDHRLNQLASSDWDNIFSNNEVWITGTHSGSLYREGGGYNSPRPIRFFDVRFNPDEIMAILSPHQAHQQSTPDPTVTVTPETERGPPVSQAHLQSWFDIYQRVYGGSAEDTLENALKSARGMFPGRFVSRDRIRDLAGGRSPGRKTRKDG